MICGDSVDYVVATTRALGATSNHPATPQSHWCILPSTPDLIHTTNYLTYIQLTSPFFALLPKEKALPEPSLFVFPFVLPPTNPTCNIHCHLTEPTLHPVKLHLLANLDLIFTLHAFAILTLYTIALPAPLSQPYLSLLWATATPSTHITGSSYGGARSV